MTIDGVDGPKGPGGPKKVERPDAVQPGEPVERTLAVDQAAPTAGVAGAATADQIVLDAIQSVKADLQSGAVASAEDALEVVIARIIESRYPEIPPKDRQAMNANLQMVLKDDPVMGELIKQMLEEA